MSDKEARIRKIHAALEYEPRVNLHRYPIKIDFDHNAAVLEGTVESVAAKKLALRLAGAIEGVRGVVDRLRVTADVEKGDGAMRDTLCAFLSRQPEFQSCRIRLRGKGRIDTIAEGSGAGCDIELAVEDGIVTFEGTVSSLAHKRIAGVLAWWTPGCRDVTNSLDVAPPQEDNDAELADALRLVLEMDPMVDADQITIACRNDVVTLKGYVRTEAEWRRVELDAWAVFAVDDVANRIKVRA